ncbi:hypothetical protein ACQFYA_21170 [Promicromonospora sp. Marseille-Q5078]
MKITLWVVGGAIALIVGAAMVVRGMQATVFAPETTEALAKACQDEVPGWAEHATVTVETIVVDEPAEVFENADKRDDSSACLVPAIGAYESDIEEALRAHDFDAEPRFTYETNGWRITTEFLPPSGLRSTYTPVGD